jgi:hypothetical protein
MDVGLNIGFSKYGIKILLCVARVAVVALQGEPRVQVIALADQKSTALGCVMRDINVGGILWQIRCALNAEFRLKILGKARGDK